MEHRRKRGGVRGRRREDWDKNLHPSLNQVPPQASLRSVPLPSNICLLLFIQSPPQAAYSQLSELLVFYLLKSLKIWDHHKPPCASCWMISLCSRLQYSQVATTKLKTHFYWNAHFSTSTFLLVCHWIIKYRTTYLQYIADLFNSSERPSSFIYRLHRELFIDWFLCSEVQHHY